MNPFMKNDVVMTTSFLLCLPLYPPCTSCCLAGLKEGFANSYEKHAYIRGLG